MNLRIHRRALLTLLPFLVGCGASVAPCEPVLIVGAFIVGEASVSCQ